MDLQHAPTEASSLAVQNRLQRLQAWLSNMKTAETGPKSADEAVAGIMNTKLAPNTWV